MNKSTTLFRVHKDPIFEGGDKMKLFEKFMFVFLLFVSIYSDLKYRKIFNPIIMMITLLGLVINISENSINGLFFSLSGIVVGFLLLLLPYIKRWVAGGDIKLISAIGSVLGPIGIIYGTAIGLVLLGIFSSWILFVKGRFKNFLHYVMLSIGFKNYETLNNIQGTEYVPYGVFLALGCLIEWIYFIL